MKKISVPLSIYSIPLFCLIILQGYAQKGFPSKDPTAASVNTSYPQHEDFKESMVQRIVVPSEFQVSIAATGLGKPRMMVVTDKGSLYITRRDQGDVILLNDADGDGKFEEMKTVLSQFKGVHGIALHDGYLYLCSNKELKRARVKPDGMLEEAALLIKDLPDGGQHGNRTLAFGPDGMLYITVGSDCNDCAETNAEHATILKAKPDGSARKIYARGLRNTIGIDWHPVTKELWGADNGTDWRGDEMLPEEINKIVEGGDYGWPYVFADQQVDKTREDPIGTTKEEYAKTTQPSMLSLPAHSAPINFVFLHDMKGLPPAYTNDALISLHGSWNRKHPEGYKVQRVHFENGKPVRTEDFFSGLLSKDGQTRFGRPAGIAISPLGMIYISDDENGVIYKVEPRK